MRFIVTAYDGADPDAWNRRMAHRQAHLDLSARLLSQGHMILAGAIFDDARERMIGSCIICDFPNREALDAWLKEDPYTLGNVWQDVRIHPFGIAPLYEPFVPPSAGVDSAIAL